MTSPVSGDNSMLISNPVNPNEESKGVKIALGVSMTAGAVSLVALVTFVGAGAFTNFATNHTDAFVYGCLGSAATALASTGAYTATSIFSYCRPRPINNAEGV